MRRDIKLYLEDILESINLINEYVAGFSEEKFLKSQALQDSVIRRLEIIGEAVKNIPAHIKTANEEVDWKLIAGTRDVIAMPIFE